MPGFSDYAEAAVLNHVTGKSALTSPTVYLALCTAAPTDASTGATLVEATYTGYARLLVAAASWNTASSPGGTITNSAQLTFANCTGSTSTIVGWALTDNATTGAGNVIMWGTATSTVISTTQTPATVAAGALSLSLD